MGKINKLEMGKITELEPTEERRKEILGVMEIMMLDYINHRAKEEKKEIEEETENNSGKN